MTGRMGGDAPSVDLAARPLFGVNVAVVHREGVRERLEGAIDHQHPCTLFFANAHTLNLARRDPDYRAVLNRHWVLNDGAGVSLASRWLHGHPFPENLNGTDLLPWLLESIRPPLRIYLLGAAPGVAESAASALEIRYPRHTVVGVSHGYFTADQEADLLERIQQLAPDLLLVAMGNPLQERWIDRHRAILQVPVLVGVGALFDFWSGRIPRAPGWMRRLRLEWAFRLLLEPRRMWRRYLVGNLEFLAALLLARTRTYWPIKRSQGNQGSQEELRG